MKKRVFVLLIILFAGIVYAANDWSILKKEQCEDTVVEYIEEVPVYENVTKYRTKYKEVEKYSAENETYYNTYEEDGQEAYTVKVKTGVNKVVKQKTVCKDTSYLEIKQDAKTLVLDHLENDFYCDQDGAEIVCDSKLDGNGDGYCASGESCYFIKEKDDCLEVLQVNSLDRGASSEELTINGMCVKVISDDSFKEQWNLVGGDLQ